jgi:uncharacterized membrane protein
VTGIIGVVASLALVLDKLALLKDPGSRLGCDFSVLLGCSTNLSSAQGEILGFPNPILGLVFWPAVVTVGVALLAGARFADWFWRLLALGAVAAFGLVVWFIGQSVFVLRVLCPWCLVTWAVTIPFFLIVVLHVLRSERMPARLRSAAGRLYGWVPLLTLLGYAVVAGLAQWQLDVLSQL